MAENNKYLPNGGCKEAVCVDAGRVYDSCSDKDCLEDLRVFFTERDQMVIDHAVSIRAKKAEVISTYIDVEALPFNRGYYSCDITFFFGVTLEVYSGHGTGCCTVRGVAIFQKKVILFGSEGKGCPEELHQCLKDHRITIPLLHPAVRSLNLSTSVGIVRYEIYRQCKV